MTDIQKQKIQWLSRAKVQEQKLSALLSVLKHDYFLLRQLEIFEDCSALKNHIRFLHADVLQQAKLLAGIREEIRQVILTIPDSSVQAIYFRKYLAFQTNEQIAEAMFYDVRTVQRKHKSALDGLSLPTKFSISETTIFQNISCEN